MNRSLIAAIAFAAGAALAAPTLAWSADDQAQVAQAGPDQRGMGPMQGMSPMQGMQGMMGGMGHEGMGHQGMMGGMMGHHHGGMHQMMSRSPKERCEERLARRAGRIAYTIAKLNLTPEQKPLWDKLNGIMQGAADKQHQLCASLPAQPGQGTILDRVNRREQFLSARLQAVQQTRPALEALYQALSPEQKAIIDHPFRR